MGGAEEVPVIREGISSSLVTLRRAGIPIIGADMDGDPPWTVRMTGPIALVLGGEDKGLTQTVRKKCDTVVGIPLHGQLDSLNVSVTAGILMFEKRRQEAMLLAAQAASSRD
jgi:23S rRNA (guanosine2251-2'-O)-methyltransferase